LNDAQNRILKYMSEMTARIDMAEFANKMGMTQSQILQDMQELVKEGFLKKTGGGYSVTEKGKMALRVVTPVSADLRFEFYESLGHPTGLSARNIKEFHDVALKVNSVSLEFHLYRGDFENWFKTVIVDEVFADELAIIRKTDLRGEELKKAIAKATSLRYGLV
jgi:DNA-binding Lrp family transcriptional regulator